MGITKGFRDYAALQKRVKPQIWFRAINEGSRYYGILKFGVKDGLGNICTPFEIKTSPPRIFVLMNVFFYGKPQEFYPYAKEENVPENLKRYEKRRFSKRRPSYLKAISGETALAVSLQEVLSKKRKKEVGEIIKAGLEQLVSSDHIVARRIQTSTCRVINRLLNDFPPDFRKEAEEHGHFYMEAKMSDRGEKVLIPQPKLIARGFGLIPDWLKEYPRH
ncbi:hypothetical protein D6829_01785 [Candidatus Pacearchaeota archaeon]|nr:MAG: hypothetical protein D6829_01785 [Candidatus Pacearchaeota archaeon]